MSEYVPEYIDRLKLVPDRCDYDANEQLVQALGNAIYQGFKVKTIEERDDT